MIVLRFGKRLQRSLVVISITTGLVLGGVGSTPRPIDSVVEDETQFTLTLNLRPIKDTYCVRAPVVVELELANRSSSVIIVDSRALGRIGVLRKINGGRSTGYSFWSAEGEVLPNDGVFRKLLPNERISQVVDLRAQGRFKPLDVGEYIIQLGYDNYSSKMVDGIAVFKGVIWSDRVLLTLARCGADSTK